MDQERKSKALATAELGSPADAPAVFLPTVAGRQSPSAGRSWCGAGRRRRHSRRQTLRQFLRLDRQRQHPRRIPARLPLLLRLVRGQMPRRTGRDRADRCRGLPQVDGRQIRKADHQTAPRRYPHAVRLSRRRRDPRHQSRPCGARAEALGQTRQDAGAVGGAGAPAARQHRYVRPSSGCATAR